MKRTLIVLLVALLGFGEAFGKADSYKEAGELENQATKDWNDGKYMSAAKKLDRAARVYLAGGARWYRDWASCERAMVWNYMKAGRKASAIKVFSNMFHVLKGRDDLSDELTSALIAMDRLAYQQSTPDDVRSVYTPGRNAAQQAGFAKLAAQILHDEAGCVASKGDIDGGISLFRQAISEREQIGDLLGRTWSYNNISYWELQEDKPLAAAKAIVRAYKAVYGKGILPPQSYVSTNLKRLLAKYDTTKDAELRPFLWQIVDAGASSSVARIIPVDAIARRLVVSDPQRVAKLEIHGALPEVTADLRIRAARAEIAKGEIRPALGLLARIDTGTGPAAPMLDARVETAVALAHAGNAEVEPFLKDAEKAAALWKSLKDRGGRQRALQDIVDAVKRLKIEGRGKAVVDEYEKLRHRGKPGVAGGSISTGGDCSGYSKLRPQDPLFTITIDKKGNVVFTDLVSKQTMKSPLSWSPQNLSLNGVTFELFGGYVTITMFAYGSVSVATGAPGVTTLDEMGRYHPLAGKGELVILKNGAVTYRTK